MEERRWMEPTWWFPVMWREHFAYPSIGNGQICWMYSFVDEQHRWRILLVSTLVHRARKHDRAWPACWCPPSESTFNLWWNCFEAFIFLPRRHWRLAERNLHSESIHGSPQPVLRLTTKELHQRSLRELAERHSTDVLVSWLQGKAQGRAAPTIASAASGKYSSRLHFVSRQKQAEKRDELYAGLCEKIRTRWQRPTLPNSRSAPSAKFKIMFFCKNLIWNHKFHLIFADRRDILICFPIKLKFQ